MIARVAWLAALALLAPDAAVACPTCTSSAFGDLSFTWPHLVLLVLPIAVASVVGGVIVYCYRRDPVETGERRPRRGNFLWRRHQERPWLK